MVETVELSATEWNQLRWFEGEVEAIRRYLDRRFGPEPFTVFARLQYVVDVQTWLLAETRAIAEDLWETVVSEYGGEERKGREDDSLPWRRP